MNKYAFVFAGQGSQYFGMGKDFYDQYDYVKSMYNEATKILGFNLEDICFKENELLIQTKYLQPSILVTSCAIYEVIKRELNIKPSVVAGFSLGEYSALYASGVFDFKEIVNLVKHRALYMEEDAKDGAMSAIVGLDLNLLEKIVSGVEGVFIANYNSPVQYVISGTKLAVKKASELAKKQGAKRVIPLNVSGAFHTQFMSFASLKMYELITSVKYKKPNIDLITNYDANKLEVEKLPLIMKKQIKSPVLWIDTIKKIINEYKVDKFIEIGPGRVLSGLIRKIDQNQTVININHLVDLNILKGEE